MSALTLAAGCQDGRQNFLTTGIGSELSAPDLAKTETLQNKYFSYLCAQATWGSPKASATCVVNDWSLIAYQGMNDIDRRCDSYLQWLDNRKRSQKPWISQIGDTAAATAAILPVVGAGTKAITIVAQAFNLVTKSVENYHSRLLLEIDTSTIHSIVLQGRSDFRKHLRDNNVRFENKPDVEHALRSYLRLCLPFAIEAKINNFSTLGARGERPDADRTLGDLPVVNSFKSSDQFTSRGRMVSTYAEARKMFRNPDGYFKSDVIELQGRLCAEPDGDVGNGTKLAIMIAEDMIHQGDSSRFDGLLDETEVSTIRGWKEADCTAEKYKGRFEYLADIEAPDLGRNVIASLKRIYPDEPSTNLSSVVSAEARRLYVRLHEDGKVSSLPGMPNNVLSRHLYVGILKAGR